MASLDDLITKAKNSRLGKAISSVTNSPAYKVATNLDKVAPIAAKIGVSELFKSQPQSRQVYKPFVSSYAANLTKAIPQMAGWVTSPGGYFGYNAKQLAKPGAGQQAFNQSGVPQVYEGLKGQIGAIPGSFSNDPATRQVAQQQIRESQPKTIRGIASIGLLAGGALYGNPGNAIGISSILSSGIAGLQGEDMASAGAAGAVQGLQSNAVVGATNPLLKKLMPEGAGLIKDRVVPMLANVAQGRGVDIALGTNPLDPTSIAIDVATGLGGKGQFSPAEKTQLSNVAKTFTQRVDPGWAIRTADGKIMSGFDRSTAEGKALLQSWMAKLDQEGLRPTLQLLDETTARQLSGRLPGFIDPSAKVGGEAPSKPPATIQATLDDIEEGVLVGPRRYRLAMEWKRKNAIQSDSQMGRTAVETPQTPKSQGTPELVSPKSTDTNQLQAQLLQQPQAQSQAQLPLENPTGSSTPVSSPTIVAPGKMRGFSSSVKQAETVTTGAKANVNGTYTPKPNEQLMGEAQALLQDGATIDFKNTKDLDKKVAATIQEAVNQDKAGNPQAAANLYNNLAEQGTELGRAVQAFSLLDKMSPEAISLSAAGKINKYNRLHPDRPLKPLSGEQVKMIADKVAAIDLLKGREKEIAINELKIAIDEFIPSSIVDKIITVWKAGLLTSLRTHERNFIGNSIHQLAEMAKDVPAAAADMVMRAKTGKRTLTATLRGSGAFGRKSTAQQMKDIITKGYDPSEQVNKFDVRRITWGNNKLEQILKGYTNAVFRTLGASDKPFYNAALARSLYDQAGAEAINVGRRGDGAFIEALVKAPTESMLKIAIGDANTATFKNRNAATNAVTALKQSMSGNEAGKLIAEITMPFTGVPSSILGQTIAYSPVGLMKGIYKTGRVLAGQVPELQRQAAQELGRGVIGTGIFALGSYLMGKGIISGQPKDAAEARQWDLENKPRNSIMIGGKWRSLNSLGPEAVVFLAGAKLNEEMNKPDGSMANYAVKLGKDYIDQSFMTGLQAPVNAITDPARYAKSYVGQLVSSPIPNLIKDAAKASDTSQRETNTVLDYAKAGVPGLRQTLIAKRDTLGNIMPQEPTGVGAFVDLFNSKTPISNTVVNELSRLNAVGNNSTPSKLTPSQTILKQKVKLTFEQLDKLEAGVGEVLRPRLEQLIASPAYQQLDDESKAKAIDNTVQDVRKKYKNVNAGAIQSGATSSTAVPTASAPSSTTPSGNYSYVDQEGNYKTMDISKIAKMPSTSKVDKLKKKQETYSMVSTVMKSDLPDDKKQQAIIELGVSKADADYYMIASEDNEIKIANAYDTLEKSGSFDDFMKYLVNGRRPVNGKLVVTDGVITDLVNEGVIPYAVGKELKEIDLYEDGTRNMGKIRAKSSKAGATAKKKDIAARMKALNQLYEDLKKINPVSGGTPGKINATKVNTKALTFSGR